MSFILIFGSLVASACLVIFLALLLVECFERLGDK